MASQRYLLLLASLLLSVLGQDAEQCRVEGECFDGDFSDETVSPSYSQCQLFCQDDDPDCTHFTYYSIDGICITFSDCPEIDGSNCENDDCYTGERDCPEDLVCDMAGECEEGALFIDTDLVQNLDECKTLCQDDDLCYWYEFDSSDNVCILFETCPKISIEDCITCVVGEKACSSGQGSGFEYIGKS